MVVQVKKNQPKLYQAVQYHNSRHWFDAQKEKIVVEHK